MMRCASCGCELAPEDFTPDRTVGDCHPLCLGCHQAAGRRVRPGRRTLERALYAAGRNLSRCQCCGSSGELEHHFLLPLVRGGAAVSRNLLVLCRECHERVHQGARIILRFDPESVDPGPGDAG